MDRTLMINDFIDYGRKSIQQINHAMGILDDPFEDIKTLVFAGMLSYYGQEYVYDIYLAFLKTSFVDSDLTIRELVSEMYNLADRDIERIVTHSPGTLYDVVASGILGTNKYKIKRTIYVSRNEVDKVTLLESVVHQMNHVINSLHNPVVLKRDLGLCSRMGISLDNFSTRRVFNLGFEDALNRLQEVDIMHEISDFGFYEIQDTKIDELVGSIFISQNDFRNDDPVVQVVGPLYENRRFNYMLVDRRISGKINDIAEEFNLKTDGSYRSLLFSCDAMVTSPSSEVREVAGEEVKKLVKLYDDNCSIGSL